MHRDIVPLLCDPKIGEALALEIGCADGDDVIEGALVTASGACYLIANRIARFVEPALYESVRSFGDQWNHFNYADFKKNWLDHTVANTVGTTRRRSATTMPVLRVRNRRELRSG